MENEQKLSLSVEEMETNDANAAENSTEDAGEVAEADLSPEELEMLAAFQMGSSFPTAEETQQAENEDAFDKATSGAGATRKDVGENPNQTF